MTDEGRFGDAPSSLGLEVPQGSDDPGARRMMTTRLSTPSSPRAMSVRAQTMGRVRTVPPKAAAVRRIPKTCSDRRSPPRKLTLTWA